MNKDKILKECEDACIECNQDNLKKCVVCPINNIKGFCNE